MKDKIRSQSLTHLDAFSYWKHREGQWQTSARVVDKVVVVEIKSFVWPQLTSQPQESYGGKVSTTSYIQLSSSRGYLWASSSYTHLNIVEPTPLRTFKRTDAAPHRWSFSQSHPFRPSIHHLYLPPHQPRRCAPENASRRPSSPRHHCPIGLVQTRSSPVLAIPPQFFQSGVDDTEPVQRVRVQRHRASLLMRCQLRKSSYTLSTNVVEGPPWEDGDLRGSLRGARQDLECCGSQLKGKRGKRVGYRIYSATATRLSLSSSLSAGEGFFFQPGLHYRLVDGGNLDQSIDHFRHDSSSTRGRPCCLKSAPNNRHHINQKDGEKGKNIFGGGEAVE